MDANRLRSSPLFEGLTGADLDRCAGLFQETEILAGASLTEEGDFAYKFFVVLDGEVAVLRDSEHVARLGPGDFFGEMGVITHGRRKARVVADTRCSLAWIMTWDFDTMAKEFSSIAARIEEFVAARTASPAEIGS